jgi:predicted dinucleotide-binding enzyme
MKIGLIDVPMLATPWPATKDMPAQAGDLAGKILIDAVNPFRSDLPGLDFGTNNSGAELAAQREPGARVAKAFNTIGNNIMADPILSGQHSLLSCCGDDARPLAQARQLEPMAMLRVSLAFRMRRGREFACQVIRR